MPFPLYHRPNALVFLDDDANYLETLALVIPQDWGVRLFTHVADCLAHFEQQHALWEADVWYHQELANTCRTGGQLIPQILEYWVSNSHRYRLTRICVVDFAMPAMTGLDFLKLLPVWPEHRVLLTGQADELIAVGAFNDGLINHYVPKQHPYIGKHLTTLLTSLRVSPMNLHEGIWRSILLQEQYAVLQESTVKLELSKLAKERQWIEYVVLPSPFGILALDRHARAHWLQLELRSELATMAELAESTGQPSAVIQKIREGTHLINTELLMALGSDEEAGTKTSFAVGGTPNLLGALFRITPDKVYGKSYQEFISSLPPRAISGDSLA
jgi:CheY-like chemotaxis protein